MLATTSDVLANIKFTPQAMLIGAAKDMADCHAMDKPTRDDEQAVSMLTDGPCNPYL
jgi:hypothetical protein